MQLSSGYKREGRLNVSDERLLHCRMVNFTCVLYRPHSIYGVSCVAISKPLYFIAMLSSRCAVKHLTLGGARRVCRQKGRLMFNITTVTGKSGRCFV
jgi:hypothetical protein